MSMGSALELIQSFNNPKFIDAPDSSLQEGKLHSGWKPLIVLRDLLQLPQLFIEMEDKLFRSLSGRSGGSFSGTGGPGGSSWGVSTISVLWTFL